MDLLARRYASPFLVLDEFIRIHQLYDFVAEVFKTMAEEKAHDARWQYYLHRVYDMSFEEYVRRCEQPQKDNQQMTHEEIRDVISTSKQMLEGFMPE